MIVSCMFFFPFEDGGVFGVAWHKVFLAAGACVADSTLSVGGVGEGAGRGGFAELAGDHGFVAGGAVFGWGEFSFWFHHWGADLGVLCELLRGVLVAFAPHSPLDHSGGWQVTGEAGGGAAGECLGGALFEHGAGSAQG